MIYIDKKTIIYGVGILATTGIVTTVSFLLSKKDSNSKQITSQKEVIKTTALTTTSFQITGTNSAKSIKLRDGVILPKQVTVKYYQGTKQNPDDSDYGLALNNLSNGDIVAVKFLIKPQYATTHHFPKEFTNIISLEITNDKFKTIINDISKLIPTSFETVGSQGNGTVKLKNDITLPKQVAVKYYQGLKQNPDNSDYNYAPNNLSNGDVVKIKFFIKENYQKSYKLPVSSTFKNPIIFIVNGFKILVDGTNLVSSSFKIIGNEGQGTIGLKDDINLPEAVEIRYYKGQKFNLTDADYKLKAPNDLKNDDNVLIKFFIKKENFNTHQFPSALTNPIIYSVNEWVK